MLGVQNRRKLVGLVGSLYLGITLLRKYVIVGYGTCPITGSVCLCLSMDWVVALALIS